MSEIDKLPGVMGNSYDPLVIATEEVKRRLPNLIIRRTLEDGTTEDWLLNDKNHPMEFPRV
jgi:DNA-directed RNA polymerase subunit K/omega